jgi:integrase
MEGARYLEDGKLTVFRRAGIYYARLRLAGSPKYITRSLGTSNEQAAVDLGRRLLFQLEQRADEGLPPKSKLLAPSLMTTFDTVSGIIAMVALQREC